MPREFTPAERSLRNVRIQLVAFTVAALLAIAMMVLHWFTVDPGWRVLSWVVTVCMWLFAVYKLGQVYRLRKRTLALAQARPRPDWLEALGRVPIMFWVCPVREHGNRNDERGWPVVTVEWDGDVARCTAPGCGRTSEDESTS